MKQINLCIFLYSILHSISIDLSLLERIFVPLSILQIVCIVARVLEWAVTLAFVEVAARNFTKSLGVLLDELILARTLAHHFGGWDHQVTIFSANRTSSKMGFLNFLIIASTPVSYAVKAEAMCAAFKNSESLSFCKNRLKTDDAVLVTFVVYKSTFSNHSLSSDCFTFRFHAIGVLMPAAISKLAITS
jgi:hypothetical protein